MSVSDGDGELLRHIRHRRRNLTLSLASIALLAVGVLAFLHSTHVAEFSIEPVDADPILKRKEGVLLTLGRRVLLYSSDGVVTVAAPGFFPRDVAVSIADSPPRHQVVLNPLPGIVSISVDSKDDFLVRLDGRIVGSDPDFELELPPGTYPVTIQGPRLQPMETQIDVAGRGTRQAFSFAPTATATGAYVDFRIAAVPSFARILVDGLSVGTGEYREPIQPGVHQIAVEADNYVPHRRQIDVPVGAAMSDIGTIVLEPLPARVSVSSTPAGATVLLDGKYRGDTPLQLELQPHSDNRLSIRKTGFRPADDLLNPLPNARIERSYHLTTTTYEARITANMPAQIAVNGRVVGSTPLILNVADDDQITASAQGFLAQPVHVVPGGDGPRNYAFRLLEPAQFAFEAAAPETTAPTGITLRRFPALSFDARTSDAAPATPVELSRPFYFAIHETTVAAYRAFSPPFAPDRPPDLPAVSVTWQDAARFCNWLSAEAGLSPAYSMGDAFPKLDPRSLGFRLPTEAEWEAVARYDFSAARLHARTHPWGTSPSFPRAFANLAGRELRSASSRPGTFFADHVDNHRDLAPVGSYPANVNGVHDLWGNASEWVNDYYSAGPFQPERRPNPLGPHTGTDHVVRGANYTSADRAALSAGFRSFAANKDDTVGFRIARWIH